MKNSNDPTSGNITEEKECELQEFIEYTEIIIGTLGYKVFVPIVSSVEEPARGETPKNDTLVYLKRTAKKFQLNAIGKMTSEGFVVLKGSVVSPTQVSRNISPGVIKQRAAAKIEDNILKEDILFNSPSEAASFVIGNSANGWQEWKAEDGTPLSVLEKRE